MKLSRRRRRDLMVFQRVMMWGLLIGSGMFFIMVAASVLLSYVLPVFGHGLK